MKIIRDKGNGFVSEDGLARYFFEINGREAVLFANTQEHIPRAIEAFLFYSGFVTSIKDRDGSILLARTASEPFLCEIRKIQPSQFYINEEKLKDCKKWLKRPEDVYIPIAVIDGEVIALDGHTRMRAAVDLGHSAVYAYADEYDDCIFHFAAEAIKRGIIAMGPMSGNFNI